MRYSPVCQRIMLRYFGQRLKNYIHICKPPPTVCRTKILYLNSVIKKLIFNLVSPAMFILFLYSYQRKRINNWYVPISQLALTWTKANHVSVSVSVINLYIKKFRVTEQSLYTKISPIQPYNNILVQLKLLLNPSIHDLK